MPFYKYYCEANGQTVEVKHPVTVKLNTWAGVCLLAKRDPGNTPPQTPVVRLLSEAMPFSQKLKGLDKDQPSQKLEM